MNFNIILFCVLNTKLMILVKKIYYQNLNRASILSNDGDLD